MDYQVKIILTLYQDLEVEKGFSMKVSYSIFAIILSLICIMYLLFYPHHDYTLFHSFSAKALAKETYPQDEHNTLSDALSLSMETSYQEHIAAHDTRYYYFPNKENICITITSTSIGRLNVSLLADSGKSISYRTQSAKNARTLVPSISSTDNTRRIFLCLVNQSANSCTLSIKIYTVKQKVTHPPATVSNPSHKATRKPASKATSKPINKTTSNPVSKTTLKPINKTTSNPANKTTSKPINKTTSNPVNTATLNPDSNAPKSEKKNIIIYPEFICIKPDSEKNLHIKHGDNSSDYIWLSSNPLIATVTNGKIHAIKEGIAIIYVRKKNSPANHASSCFVRVIEGT